MRDDTEPDPIAGIAVELEATARAFVREHRLPGVAVGVVHGDRLVWSSGVGFADIATRRAQSPDAQHRIASITKTFTGTAIMQLRDKGALHLDDAAVTYLPELRGAESGFGPIETVTIRRLLSHESGLMGDPPGTEWSAAVYEGDPAANLARVAEIGTRIPPNAQQKYSNMGYQLLGEVVARVSGSAYAEYVQREILDPLGLAFTSYDPLPDELAARRATGYGPRAFSDDLVESIPAPTTQAEGGLWSCVEDLARWIAFQLREDGGPRDGAQVLAGPTLKEMHRPRYLGDDAWTEAWCIAWYAVRRDGVVWVQHSGGLHGFITNVCFDPVEKVGAIALLNGEGSAADLAMSLAAAARAALRTHPAPIDPPQPLPERWRELLGIYADRDYYMVVRLEWRDGKLTFLDADQPDWRPTLQPTADPDVFVVEPGVRESGEACTILRTDEGRIRGLTAGNTLLHRLDPVA